MHNVSECRRGCWRYSGDIGVIDIVIVAVKQIQKLGRNAPLFVDVITDLSIDQYR